MLRNALLLEADPHALAERAPAVRVAVEVGAQVPPSWLSQQDCWKVRRAAASGHERAPGPSVASIDARAAGKHCHFCCSACLSLESLQPRSVGLLLRFFQVLRTRRISELKTADKVVILLV